MKVIAFDAEMTAPEPGQICQIAYLTIEGARVTGRNLYFTVDAMTPRAFGIHGLSPEALAALSGGRRFEDEAASLLADFTAAGCVVGHGAAGDLRFLRAEFLRCGLDMGEINAFCTRDFFVRMRRVRDHARVGWPSLRRLCAWYGVTAEETAARCGEWFSGGDAPHDARFDAAATWLCVRAAAARGDLEGFAEEALLHSALAGRAD
ncbi:MAG: hypothetical protein IKO07_13410 [Clostridia bacterium]|nr:hypothetical protein [Clostridia bacterium]